MGRKKAAPYKIGTKIFRWTIIGTTDTDAYQCRCDCGTERIVKGDQLRRGKSTCCGCVRNRISNIPKHPSAAFIEDIKNCKPQYVSEKYGLTYEEIRRYRDRQGFSSVYNARVNELRETIIDLFKKGNPVTEISRQVNIPAYTVLSRLQKYGYQPESYVITNSEAPYEDTPRDTWGGFKAYWSHNTDYFRDMFSCDYTPKNAWVAFQELNG